MVKDMTDEQLAFTLRVCANDFSCDACPLPSEGKCTDELLLMAADAIERLIVQVKSQMEVNERQNLQHARMSAEILQLAQTRDYASKMRDQYLEWYANAEQDRRIAVKARNAMIEEVQDAHYREKELEGIINRLMRERDGEKGYTDDCT